MVKVYALLFGIFAAYSAIAGTTISDNFAAYNSYQAYDPGGSGFKITFNAPTLSAGWTLTYPASGGTNGYCLTTNGSGTTSWSACQTPITTGNLTDAGTDGITVGNGSGAVLGTGTTLSQHVADTSHNGYLASADWNTFNGKQAALTFSAPLVDTSNTVTCNVASGSQAGCLSSSDWTSFNNKGSGTVTAVSVASVNGFAGSSSGGATPALTISTSITGILKGNGTAVSAATSGTDYAPATSGSSILYGNGSGGFSNVTVGTGLSFSGGTLSATGSLSWQSTQTSNFTATAGNAYPVNTTSSSVEVTLPASPSAGNLVYFMDYAGTFATNNLTVNPNGNKLNSSPTIVSIATNREAIGLVYVDSTQGWIPYGGFNTSTPTGNYSVSYVVEGGGGGAGSNSGGGGGGGQFQSGSVTLTVGTVYSVTVGAGGAGVAASTASNGANGSSSVFDGVTSVGGGGGGNYYSSTAQNGSSGASGGGGNANGTTSGGSATAGNAGGSGTVYDAGGGGGAGGAGGNAVNGVSGGAGGIGIASSITGSSVYYGGGGSAGITGSGGSVSPPASGGGGAGGTSPNAGSNGTANTGGGGGGGGGAGMGGNGGSGVVIISVPTSKYSGTTTGSPTVTTSGGNTILTFTANGSYTG